MDIEINDDGNAVRFDVKDGWWLYRDSGNKAHYFKDGRPLCGFSANKAFLPLDLYRSNHGHDYPATQMDDDPWWHCAKCKKLLAKQHK